MPTAYHSSWHKDHKAWRPSHLILNSICFGRFRKPNRNMSNFGPPLGRLSLDMFRMWFFTPKTHQPMRKWSTEPCTKIQSEGWSMTEAKTHPDQELNQRILLRRNAGIVKSLRSCFKFQAVNVGHSSHHVRVPDARPGECSSEGYIGKLFARNRFRNAQC